MIKCITDSASIRLINCSTLELNYFDDILIDCEDVLENLWHIDQISKGRTLNHLIVLSDFTQFELDAKQLLATENIKRKNRIKSEAIVVKSIAARLMVNYYKNQINNIFPIKLFKNTLEAKKWLLLPEKDLINLPVEL